MTIKKPMKASGTAAKTNVSAPGGAAIADRFKLDMQDPSTLKSATSKATVYAVVAGFAALAVAGVLTYILWQHWEFLMPA